MMGQQSRRRSWESGWSAASQPSASARRTSAANASMERASNRFRPKRGGLMGGTRSLYQPAEAFFKPRCYAAGTASSGHDGRERHR